MISFSTSRDFGPAMAKDTPLRGHNIVMTFDIAKLWRFMRDGPCEAKSLS